MLLRATVQQMRRNSFDSSLVTFKLTPSTCIPFGRGGQKPRWVSMSSISSIAPGPGRSTLAHFPWKIAISLFLFYPFHFATQTRGGWSEMIHPLRLSQLDPHGKMPREARVFIAKKMLTLVQNGLPKMTTYLNFNSWKNLKWFGPCSMAVARKGLSDFEGFEVFGKRCRIISWHTIPRPKPAAFGSFAFWWWWSRSWWCTNYSSLQFVMSVMINSRRWVKYGPHLLHERMGSEWSVRVAHPSLYCVVQV